MTPTFFDTSERRQALLAAAAAWNGTPFFANSMACGRQGGVDCVRLLLAIYTACGVLPHFEIPHQAMDHGQHSAKSYLLEAFRTWPSVAPFFSEIPGCSPANIVPGDALLFRAGLVPHHAGLMVTRGEFLHAMVPSGVHLTHLSSAIRGQRIIGRLAGVFRPIPQ